MLRYSTNLALCCRTRDQNRSVRIQVLSVMFLCRRKEDLHGCKDTHSQNTKGTNYKLVGRVLKDYHCIDKTSVKSFVIKKKHCYKSLQK